MNKQSSPIAAPAPAPVYIACRCGDGPIFYTTLSDCKNGGPNCGPAGRAEVAEVPPTLFPYRLPSGREVVGSADDFQKDKGTLIYAIDPLPSDASKLADKVEVICLLPSGRAIVSSYDECVLDGGQVVGALHGRIAGALKK